MIAIGRALLADSHWPVKVAEGKANDIRPCIGCHDGCIGSSCAANHFLAQSIQPAEGKDYINWKE